MNDFASKILALDFQSVRFVYSGETYIFSSDLILTWQDGSGEGIRMYDSREEFLGDTVFYGRNVSEIENELEQVVFKLV